MTFQQVVKHFGSVSKAATALGLSRQAVYLWREQGIKRDRQKLIEMATEGALKADGKGK